MRISQRIDESRMSELEQRVAEIASRLDRLESRGRFVEAPAEEPEEVVAGAKMGTEYWIGARLLPRMGAVIIILAIAFVAISETSKHSSIDRALLLIIEALFCLGFIVVGEWKRDELEGFGKTLSAIGSCGLYLTAAGGHFAYHTVTAAGMAAGFALLSLLNHAYAVYRNTRLFFFIGATGGLVAMLFPLAEQDYGTGLAVYVTVTVAAAVVCAIRKWLLLAFVGWLLGLAILFPVIDSTYPRAAVLIALYVGSLTCIGAYVSSHKGKDYDLPAIGAGVAVFLTGMVGFGVKGGTLGIVHLVPFALLGIAMAVLAPKGNLAARCLLIGSAATAALLVPLCLAPPMGTYAYIAITGIAAVVSNFFGKRLSAVFSVVGFLAAGITYAAAAVNGNVGNENLLLLALLVGIGLTASSLQTAGGGWVSFVIGSLWALLARWSVVLSPGGEVEFHSFSLLTIVSVAYALTLLTLGFRKKSGQLRMWSIAVMLASVFQILVLEQDTAVGFRLTALLILGGIMLVGGFRYVRDRQLENPDEESPQLTVVSEANEG